MTILGFPLWLVALGWAAMGWLTTGAMVWFRYDWTVQRGLTLVTLACLVAWPGAVVALALSFLGRLAVGVFHPQRGPVAMVVGLVHAAGTPTAEPPPTPSPAEAKA